MIFLITKNLSGSPLRKRQDSIDPHKVLMSDEVLVVFLAAGLVDDQTGDLALLLHDPKANRQPTTHHLTHR